MRRGGQRILRGPVSPAREAPWIDYRHDLGCCAGVAAEHQVCNELAGGR
jgi:hypothetical protein